MWLLYQLLLAIVTFAAGPWLLIRRGRHYLASLSARLGNVPDAQGDSVLWIHAVSVGEVNVAASLKPILPPDQRLLVTTVTPSGQKTARDRFPDALVTYLPFELGFAVRKFFERLTPAALILCEGDLWPLVLRDARRRRIPVVVVNGRISEKSFKRMKLLRPFLSPLLKPVDGFAVQTAEDSRRLQDLGVEAARITVTGNLKFELATPSELPEIETAIVRLARGRPILVAGSTMEGEEEQVLAAHDRAGGGARALLVLAPRHPERWPRVAAQLERSGTRACLRSDLDGDPGAETARAAETPPDVLLLDSLGELASIYRLGAAAFIGGTLVSTGGHNPLEAARHGVPVAAGPSMHNFKDIAHRFDAERAWGRVADGRELGELWDRWLADPDSARRVGARGQRLVESNRGALARTRSFLEERLGEVLGA